MFNFNLVDSNSKLSLFNKFSDVISDFKNKNVIVVGDFFLDRFVYYDSNISNVSVYSGGPSISIDRIDINPGAAGTVAKNLSFFGVNVYAVGVCGKDGDGYDLKRKLSSLNINSDNIIELNEKKTSSYTMLMKKVNNEYSEFGECVVENKELTAEYIENEIIKRINVLISDISPDAIIFLDQECNENYGVVTNNIRKYIKDLSKKHPDILVYLDSRSFLKDSVGSCIIKCNNFEFCKMFSIADEELVGYCRNLSEKSRYPIVVTLGENGTLVAYNGDIDIIPTYNLNQKIDTRGAGDAFTSGFLTCLCSGFTIKDSAIIGTVVSSICISQIATTGFFDIKDILNFLSNNNLNYDKQLGLSIGDKVSSKNNKYKILSFLNKGKNGIVYYVECIEGKIKGKKAALKIQYNLETKRLARFYLEIDFVKKQKSDFLLDYYDDGDIFFKNNKYHFVVFSYLPYTLSTYIEQHNLTYREKIDFSYQLVSVLCEFKNQKILHRDIKPQNILTDGTRIVLGDYGLVKAVYNDDVNFDIDEFWNSSNTMPRHYRTPELVMHAKGELSVVPVESDCFQAGLVICWLMTGINPLKAANNKIEPFEFIKVPNITGPLGKDMKKIIESMIEYDYKKRESIDKVLDKLKEIRLSI